MRDVINRTIDCAAGRIGAVRALERPLFVATIAVTCLVLVGFLLGLPCGAWQWWSGVLLAAMSCWVRRDCRTGALSAALFAAFLGIFWCLANVSTTIGWEDTLRYHQPAIRMMIEGWNPLRNISPEEIGRSVGLSPDQMNVYHVVAMPRGVWYFCAAAYAFTHAQFNLLFPLVPFLFLCMALSVWDSFRHLGRHLAAVAVIVAALIVRTHDCAVDCVVALSAVGLLASMFDTLRTGRWNGLRLVGFSFWMTVAKQPALLQCALCWMLFLPFLVFRHRQLVVRIFGVGFLIFGLFAITSVSPYGTSWFRFGHPLYPRYTGDAEKWPARNITGDFFDRNEDAARMSHGWAYVNAYVSSSLCRSYYEATTGKAGFSPWSFNWLQQDRDPAGTPTSWKFRLMYCLTLLVMLLFAGMPGRFIACCLMAGALVLPTEMVGYLRYSPWITCGIVFALQGLGVFGVKVRDNVGRTLLLAALVVVVPRLTVDCAIRIDNCSAVRTSLSVNPPNPVIAAFETLEGRYAHGDRPVSANAALLVRQTPQLSKCELVIDPTGKIPDPLSCPRFYDCSFRVPANYDLSQHSPFLRLQKESLWRKRIWKYPQFVLQTYFVELPRCLWMAVKEI